MSDNERVKQLLQLLQSTYPHARIALHFSNPWELLVAVMLSAQCTDIIVNKVTSKLFRKYTMLDDYVKADITEFEQDIKSTGFFRNKAKNILTSSKLIKKKFKEQVPNTMEDLLTLPGVARKTANVVLGNAYKVVCGIAVDTHVHRISQRLRLIPFDKIGGKKQMTFQRGKMIMLDYIKDADPNKIEQELMKVIPEDEWFSLTYRIIDHGRSLCKAQNPQCKICPLQKLCPGSRAN